MIATVVEKCNLRSEDAHIVQDPVLIRLGVAHSGVDDVLDLRAALSRASHDRCLHRFVEVGAREGGSGLAPVTSIFSA